jgi:hypothetical protein
MFLKSIIWAMLVINKQTTYYFQFKYVDKTIWVRINCDISFVIIRWIAYIASSLLILFIILFFHLFRIIFVLLAIICIYSLFFINLFQFILLGFMY